jgi:hypothetical protein
MRLIVLLSVLMCGGTSPAIADTCRAEDGVRLQAECIHGKLAPDVFSQLYKLALAVLPAEAEIRVLPRDFFYVAEEAGEAARRKGTKMLVKMASSEDFREAAFAARAITAFVDAVRDGSSHLDRFGGKGDAQLLERSKRELRPLCRRLVHHRNDEVRGEGQRCLMSIDPPNWFGGGQDVGVDENKAFGSGGLKVSGTGSPKSSSHVGLPTPEAAASYRRDCDKGKGKGCYLLAQLNRFERFGPGQTYPKDIKRAVELYGRGCDVGFAESCAELAEMYRAGEEVPRNPARAASLDRQACKLGRKPSCRK